MAKKLLQSKLHELFLEDVKPYAEDIVNIGKKPLLFKLTYPYSCNIKAYLFNCTAPPGGRTTQTIGQAARNVHKRLRQVEYRTQAPDHPILWSADESYYLKFYIFQVCSDR